MLGQVAATRAGAADSLLQLLEGNPHASAEQRAAWSSRLGHVYADRYQYDSAIALYSQALAGYRDAGNEEMAFDVLFDLGYMHYAMYEYSRALEIYHESLELAESLDNDSLRAVAYDWISLQYLYSGAYGQAITNQLASIGIREARRDSAGLAESFYSMGDILSHQEKLAESNAYFRRCISLASQFDQKSLLLGAYGTIGAAFIDQNQWDSAFWYNRVALRIAQQNQMDYGIAFANGALGKCHLAKGNLDSAEICYRQSLEVALKMSEHSEISQSLLGLGLLAQRKGDTQQALLHFREGLKVGKAYSLTDVEEEAYANMAETFHLAGMHDSAYAYQLKLLALKDTLFADRSKSMVSTLEARYGILQNEANQQALLIAKDRQIKTLTLLVSGVGALLTLGFLWFSYHNYRNQRRLNAVLESHNQTMEKQNEKLTLANEDLKQFAYAASHDLKQPLRTIGNFSTLIERKFKPYIDEDTEDYFQYIQRAVRDMSSLLTNLLQYTQLENKAESFEELDMNDVLATVTNNLGKLIEERKANVMAEYLPRLMANREHMIQLFQNLVNNALKFNDKPYPEVLISYAVKGSSYCFSIRDNGIGIEPAYQERIFGLFQRVGDKEEYEGSGMGLAIAKRIVRQYQGDIWVESKPQCGSTFHFTLPIHT
jgi:signal transduction histidine kinase